MSNIMVVKAKGNKSNSTNSETKIDLSDFI